MLVILSITSSLIFFHLIYYITFFADFVLDFLNLLSQEQAQL